MPLTVYNTLTHQKEVFAPLEEGKVRMYNCGPTVYKDQHIGNFRAYLLADLLRRYFELRGHDVTQVMNAATDALTVLVRDSVTVIGLIAFVFWLDWRLSTIIFVLMPAIGLVAHVMGKRLRGLNRRLQANVGDLTHRLEESVRGHKEVKIFQVSLVGVLEIAQLDVVVPGRRPGDDGPLEAGDRLADVVDRYAVGKDFLKLDAVARHVVDGGDACLVRVVHLGGVGGPCSLGGWCLRRLEGAGS